MSSQARWLKHYDPEVPPHLTYPRMPIYCLLDETAARQPASPCTNFFGKRLTYRQIKELSDRFAASARKPGHPKRAIGWSCSFPIRRSSSSPITGF